jgi:hypothetical protein
MASLKKHIKHRKTTMTPTITLARSGFATAALLSAFILPVHAKVPPEQTARLSQDLTPLGSERAGNADGSIPAWTGGITAPPKGIGYEKGKHLPDPFAADKPLFRVDGTNLDKYDAFITRGQKALMQRHSTYFLDVYPTRRSCAQPEHVYKAAVKNSRNEILRPSRSYRLRLRFPSRAKVRCPLHL